MTTEQIKDYLKKYRIDSEEQLAKHIEELKRNTIPTNEIIFPLVDMLVNEKSVLNSFFAENKKIKNPMTYLDEALENIVKKEQQIIKDWNSTSTGEGEFLVFATLEKELASDKDLHLSTRHKSKVGETHKEGLEEVMNLINSDKFKQDCDRTKEAINDFCKNEGIPFHYEIPTEKTEKEEKVRANFYKIKNGVVSENEVNVFTNMREARSYFKFSNFDQAFYYTFGTWNKIDEEHKTPNSHILKSKEVPLGLFCKKESQTVEKAPIFTHCKVNKNALEGIKETKGKLYYELSWEFIEEMAKRMANNKSDKYPLYNWKKNIDIEDLKQAINRHHIEVMKGNYRDGSEILGHIVSYACNSMMLWEQLNKNQ